VLCVIFGSCDFQIVVAFSEWKYRIGNLEEIHKRFPNQ